jgi:hypothetical protein
MRLLLLMLIVAAAAYYTNPPREKFEAEARAAIQAQAAQNVSPAADDSNISLDDVVGYVKGMMAGQGKYENYYLAGRYTIDMPGADYLECYGAFTVVKCQVKRD